MENLPSGKAEQGRTGSGTGRTKHRSLEIAAVGNDPISAVTSPVVAGLEMAG